jgi:hypothetical protein
MEPVEHDKKLDRLQWWMRLTVTVLTGILVTEIIRPPATIGGKIVDVVNVLMLGCMAWQGLWWSKRWRHLADRWRSMAYGVRETSMQLLDQATAVIEQQQDALRTRREPWQGN